ncbi:holin family protein (plasmid) [Anoxybacillus sp. B7M1]|uniref:phage holin family protein n=1 Tax=Anoxybacillus sp. B7M1 TaxID=1490057 RepID=UPI0007B597D2|nr:phage holin family protein [Anoxybacillus sp. B7M1]ANB66170.1 holin family protein [Anoxybacillus sp. B7M1]
MRLSAAVFNVKSIFTREVFFAGGLSAPIGYVLEGLYGANNLFWVGIMLMVIAFDWGSGIAAAKKDGVYSSEYGRVGVIRTAVMLLFPVLGNLFDKALGTPGFFFFFFAGGITYHTWMSMTANFARAGWDKWIPNWMLEKIASEIQAKTQRALERKQQFGIGTDNTTDEQKAAE